MPRKHKHHAGAHLHRRHHRSLNFTSGIVYATAVIVSIAMGALFYSGYQRAQRNLAAASLASQPSPNIPPGAKAIVRDGKAVQAARPAPTPAKGAPSSTPATNPPAAGPVSTSPPPAQLAANPASQPVTPATDALPAIRPAAPTSWSAVFAERTALRQQKIVPTADTCVFAQPAAGREVNGGAATELPLKGNDSFILTRYDVEKIRGWTLSKATWHGKVRQGRIASLGFSTIMADWTEGSGTLKGPATGGATYRWRDAKTKPWREPDVPVTHVIRGNGHSLMSVGEPDKPDNGTDDWIAVSFDPVVVQALIADAAYGIAITDEKGQRGIAAAIGSREDSNSCPFIEVEGAPLDMTPPAGITNARAYAHPTLARRSSVGALLTWTATGDDGPEGQAFRYDIRCAPRPTTFERARELPRSLLPGPQPAGRSEQLVIEDLDPETTYSFFLRAVDETGQAGPVTGVSLQTGPLLAVPDISAAPSFDATPIDVVENALNLRVVDELSGVDPVSGTVAERSAAAPVLTATSPIWDRSSRTLHLRAAQNETIGFTVALQRRTPAFPPVTITAPAFQGAKGPLAGKGVRFSRVCYACAAPGTPGARVASRGDALVALEGRLDPKTPAGSVVSQSVQCVYAELHIPGSAPAGTYRSELVVTRDDKAESRLNVLLDVLPVRLPDRPRFAIELVVPAPIALLYKKEVGNRADAAPIEEAYQRIARDSRCTAAFLPYLRNGTSTEPFAPRVTGSGLDASISSWEDWDDRYRGYLTGSAFAGSEEGEFPVDHILLPVFENWPTPFESGYSCAEKDVQTAAGLKVFGGRGDEAYECLSSDYWRALRAVVQQFRDHFHLRVWTETAAHVWLNNEPVAQYSGKPPPWFLGKPLYHDDFAALEAFAQAAALDAATWTPNKFFYRVHVPDAVALAGHGMQQFSLLAACDTDPGAWRLLRDRIAVTGEELWFQSDTLPFEDASIGIELTALKYFLEGANGWAVRDVVGRTDSLSRAQPSSVFYAGTPLGMSRPLPSLRLKALRRAEQDIEYLLLLQDRMGWTRQQLRDFVHQRIPSLAETGAFSAQDAYQLRFAVQDLLTRK
jgi:hypothetical protein